MVRALAYSRLSRCTFYRQYCAHVIPDYESPQLRRRHAHSKEGAEVLARFSQRLQEAVNPGNLRALASRGWAVVDGVFDRPSIEILRQEIIDLKSRDLLHKNQTHFVALGVTERVDKERIWEAELTFDETVQERCPVFASLARDFSLATLINVFLPGFQQRKLDSQALKLQYNEGRGGCFPIHPDTHVTLDERKVTAIFYLNDNWKQGDGGELRLYPFPGGPIVDIPPLGGRLVLFSSHAIPHRTLPSHAPRYCFTSWLSCKRRPWEAPSARVPSPPLLPAPGDPPLAEEVALRYLMSAAAHMHVCKLVYVDEWAASLEQSHPACESRDRILERHWSEVAAIKRALAPYLDASPVLRQVCELAKENADHPQNTVGWPKEGKWLADMVQWL
eukprot:jgi/Mesvir1/19593/Mv26413-RA.1